MSCKTILLISSFCAENPGVREGDEPGAHHGEAGRGMSKPISSSKTIWQVCNILIQFSVSFHLFFSCIANLENLRNQVILYFTQRRTDFKGTVAPDFVGSSFLLLR